MNFTNTNNNKCNLRIANGSLPLQVLQLNNNNNDITDTSTYSDISSENNYHSDTISDTNNNNCNNISNHRFSSHQSSPSLENYTNTVSFALLNVRGINSPTKFDTILEDLTDRSFSVIGLQETKIKESSANMLYKNFSRRNTKAQLYKAYWDHYSQDTAAGVGLLIASYISKYVQKIHRKDGRFIALDLFLPDKKLKIINIYAHQGKNFATKGKTFTKFVIEYIKQAEKDKFQCIIMGDFNADPFKYHQFLEKERSPPAFYQLIEFLTERNYIDQTPKDHKGKEFATFYSDISNSLSSRIDLIWYPDEIIRNVFCFDQVWHLPSAQLTTDASASLDHRCIIVFFTKHLLLGHLSVHRKKQKGEWRTVYNLKACKQEDWNEFRRQVNDWLQSKMVADILHQRSLFLSK